MTDTLLPKNNESELKDILYSLWRQDEDDRYIAVGKAEERIKGIYAARDTKMLEHVIGEDETDLAQNENNYWTYPKVRNRERAEQRERAKKWLESI